MNKLAITLVVIIVVSFGISTTALMNNYYEREENKELLKRTQELCDCYNNPEDGKSCVLPYLEWNNATHNMNNKTCVMKENIYFAWD